MRTRPLFALLAALACSFTAAPAHARARVFVASYGNDSNPCTFLSPCKTFQQAVNVVDAGGEVTAIDSAGFGPILITKAVTITSPNGVEAGIVPVSGGNSITINAPLATVTLSGLTIDGGGAGANGILVSSGGALVIQDCVIRNMTGDGIHFVSNFDSSLSVANTFVGNNGGYGIFVQPVGSASVTAVFERVRAQYNGPNGYGIALDASLTAGSVNGTATDTVSSNNGGGFLVQGSPSNVNNLMVMRSVAANNHTAVQGDTVNSAKSSTVFISESTITGNFLACNGVGKSYGDNTIKYNVEDFCNAGDFSLTGKE